MSAKIIVSRKSELLNRGRRYKLLIDGREAGSVGNDNAEEFVVEPGKHSIQAQHSWYKTEEFYIDVADNTSFHLKLSSGLKYYFLFYTLLIAGVLIPLILKFAKVERADWWYYGQMILIAPFLVYMAYFTFFNRKNYLVIEKDTEHIFSR